MKQGAVPALMALCLAGPARAEETGVQTIEVPITGQAGAPIGKLTIRGSANATVFRVAIDPGGLTPGWHGIHVHAVGDCSDVGQFRLAKGHVNHLAKKHGLLNAEGPDEGDLPNIYAGPDGSVNAELSSHVIRLLGQTGLRDADGSAVVIQANEDDHTSQPIGNAGARVACAAIR
jgi:superoxide dismutase, Cu-Zn family